MKNELAVVIPAFRCEETIEATLDSVAGQSRPADHIVVVLDEPNPRLEKICRQHSINAEIFVNEKNLGVGATRNIGFNNIRKKADMVCFLDSDDLLHPEFFSMACKQFVRNPDADAVFGRFSLWRDGELPARLPDAINEDVSWLDSPLDVYLSDTGGFLLSFALFSTRSIESVSLEGKINAEILRNNQDFEFICRVLYQGVVARIESECGWHKKMPGSLSSNQPRAWYFRSIAAKMLYEWFSQHDADQALLVRMRRVEHSAIRRSARLYWSSGERKRAAGMLFNSMLKLQPKSLAQLVVLVLGVQSTSLSRSR